MIEEKDKKIVTEIIRENRSGLKRLADEEPAKERRSAVKTIKRKIKDFFTSEEKVGHIMM